MSQLAYRHYWWVAGGIWLCVITYLSLANLSLPQIDLSYGDKLNHSLAYGFLMGWFGQLTNKAKWPVVAIVLVLLGALMELLQGMLPHRWFDLQDAVANFVGVVLGLGVLHLGGDRLLLTIERSFFNKGK